MSRFTFGVVIAASLASSITWAETQAEIAARDNEEGKELMFAGKFAEASAKFRDAVDRVPEAKYFFNLCTSLYQEGKFGMALTACNAVAKNNADDKLKGKTDKLIEKIREEAKNQNIDLQPTGGGGGDPNVTMSDPAHPPDGGTLPPPNGGTLPPPTGTGTPPAQPVYAVGRPPTQGLFTATAPSHDYTWSLGLDIYGGGANIGQTGAYGTASGGVRFKGDYMLVPAAKLGLQGYMQITNIGEAKNAPSPAFKNLDIFDIGIAGYKHFCAAGRLCLTPLLGVHLSVMDPNQDQGTGAQTFNYAALGARGEVALSYAFGTRYEYVLAAMLGFNAYTRAADPSDAPTAMEVGLDKGGPAGYFGLGFTYRFNTPFGQAPFVTLE